MQSGGMKVSEAPDQARPFKNGKEPENAWRVLRVRENVVSDNLANRVQLGRFKISVHEEYVVKHWTRALCVSSKDRFQKAVD